MRSFDDVVNEMHGQLTKFIDRLIDITDPGISEYKPTYGYTV